MLKTFVFVVLLVFQSVICKDEWICQYIKRNGRYDGLGIYHRMVDQEVAHLYLMYNRFGNQWRFEVTKPPQIGLKLVDNYVRGFNAPNIVNRFSVFEPNRGRPRSCECNLTSIPGSTEIEFNCIRKSYSDPPIGGLPGPIRFKRKDVRNRVILKAQPSVVTTGKEEQYIMMLKKGDHPDDYDPIAVNGCGQHIEYCSRAPYSKNCKTVPKFVGQMDPKLFKSIEGVVDFRQTEISGHLLLLNISGRPKICVTLEDQNISAECNSAEKMRPLFKECFKDEPTPRPTPTLTSKPKIETKSTKFWLILVIILIIIGVIVAIVCFCCRKRRRNPNHFHDAFNTVLHRDPKTLSSRREQTSTGSNTLIDSTKSTHTERAKTSISPPKGTQFKTGVKTTKNPPKTSAKPSQSPKT